MDPLTAEPTRCSLQEYADKVVAPEYRQPLKTAVEVATLQGWGDPDSPVCCGGRVSVRTMIGDPYYAVCNTCGKWAASMDGPSFTENGNAVFFLDDKKIDLDTEATWIIGASAPVAGSR